MKYMGPLQRVKCFCSYLVHSTLEIARVIGVRESWNVVVTP
jgi:hypothetical protein